MNSNECNQNRLKPQDFISDSNKDKANGIWGLENLGNSWYMNSALQVLCHTPEITNYFLSEEFKQYKHNLIPNWNISEEFFTVANYIWNGYRKSFTPYRFKANVKQYIDILDTDTQQDSAELLSQLLELMHNELTG